MIHLFHLCLFNPLTSKFVEFRRDMKKIFPES